MEGWNDKNGNGGDGFVHIQWPNHQPNLVSFLSESLSKKNFADVTLVSEEGSGILAHRVILSSCSSYFEEVFLNNPSDHPIVILKDVQFEDLQAIVNFIYNGELLVDKSRADSIVKTASSLRIKFLSEACRNKLERGFERPVSPTESCILSVEEISSPIAYPRTPSPPISPTLTAPPCSWRHTTATALAPSTAATERIDNSAVTKKLIISKKSASADSAISANGSGSRHKTENVTKPRSRSEGTLSGAGSSKSLMVNQENTGTSASSSSDRQPSFVITTKKKKEAWIDPDAIANKRSQQQQNTKRLKQTSLFSIALRLPQSQTKVDISKTKDYNGGTRVPLQFSGSPQPLLPVDENVQDDTRQGSYDNGLKSATPPFSPVAARRRLRRNSNNHDSFVDQDQTNVDISETNDHNGSIEGSGAAPPQCVTSNSQPVFVPFLTPENFWSTIQYSTEEFRDLVNVGTPFTPVARTRRRRNSDESFVYSDTENSIDD